MGRSTLLVMTTSSLAATGTSPPTTTSSLALKKKAANCFKCFVKLVERRKPRLCQEVVHYDRSARSFAITSIKCPRYKCMGHIKCRESSQLQPMYEIRVSFGLALTLLKFLFLLSIHETQHILQLFLI